MRIRIRKHRINSNNKILLTSTEDEYNFRLNPEELSIYCIMSLSNNEIMQKGNIK